MYDSKPKEREGEPIELVVPEAINTTASKERESGGESQSSITWPDWLPEGKKAFVMAAAAALTEAFILMLIIIL